MNEKLGKLKEDILDLLWKTPDFDAVIHEALAMIGRQFAADSAYVTEFSTDTMAFQNIYLWKPEGAEKPLTEPIELVCQHCFDKTKGLLTGEEVVYWCADDVRGNVTEILRECGVRSVLLGPVIRQGSLFAYFGVSDSAARREDWERDREVRTTVSTLSKMIGTFLLKTRYAKHSEQVQHRLEASLQTSEQRADTAYDLLDGISAGVIIVNIYPDGRAFPQYGNLGLYRMLRIPRTAEDAVVPDRSVAALEGSYFDDFFANIPEPDYSRVRREYKDGFFKDHFTVKKYRLLRGDGTYVWVNADLSLREARPGYRTYYATYADMSEEQSLQTGLMEMLEKEKEITAKLEQANQAKSDFLSRMSHDIRTPMNAIMGMNSIAISHIDSPGRVLDCLDKISASSKLLLNIINEVLDMSKMDSGHLVLAEEAVDLAELAQSVVTMIQPLIGEKNLSFEARINDVAHKRVVGDMTRLQQLLINLLSNAVKYTPDGGEVLLEIHETPSDLAEHARYLFVVADTGIGMTSEFLTRIFEPFERAEDARITPAQGTGLGLAICKTLAEMMGGQIQVETEWGKGSRFTVTLYLRIGQESTDDGAQAGPATMIDARQKHLCSGRRLLLVEDNALNREIAVELLATTGAEIDTAENGKIAVEKVASSPTGYYQFIFMDIQMPVMDGWAAAVAIRALEREDTKTLPIVALTANAFADDRQRTREAGMNEHLAKPIDMEQLLQVLHRYLV